MQKSFVANREIAENFNLSEWSLMDDELDTGRELSLDEMRKFLSKIPKLDKEVIKEIGRIVIVGYEGKCMVFIVSNTKKSIFRFSLWRAKFI